MSGEERHFKVSGMDDSLDPTHPPLLQSIALIWSTAWFGPGMNYLRIYLMDRLNLYRYLGFPRGQTLMALRPLTSALPCRNQVNVFNVDLNNLSRDSFDDSLELSFGYFSARVNVGHVLFWYNKHVFCRLPPYTLLRVSLKM